MAGIGQPCDRCGAILTTDPHPCGGYAYPDYGNGRRWETPYEYDNTATPMPTDEILKAYKAAGNYRSATRCESGECERHRGHDGKHRKVVEW